MTTDHRLTNPRPVPNRDATCGWCLQPLYKVHDLTEIITPRPGGPTFCCDLCWSEWVVNDKPAPNQTVPFIINPPRPERGSQALAKTSQPPRAPSWEARQAAKSNVRKTGEVAANIVGFVIWLIVVAAIASILFAACGIDTMR